MARLKNKNYKFNNDTINSGIMFLFLSGCLIMALVGGYSVMIYYNQDHTDNTPSSDQMQINSTTSQSVAEDGATATVIK